MSPIAPAERELQRIAQITSPDHCLCKDDVLWLLSWLKKRVADEDPRLLELPQPQLLRQFHCFAEIAMFLLHRHNGGEHDASRLKQWMREAAAPLQAAAEPVQSISR